MVKAAPRAVRTCLASALSALVLIGCGTIPPPAAGETFRPPKPLALVVIVDPSPGQGPGELRQLASVIQAGVTPSQTFVVSLLSGAAVAATYVVRGGDSLSSIAGVQGVSLAALQDANPQLGPLASRDWNRIYPGDRVTVPQAQAASAVRNAIVTRAPAGPPAPALVRAPAPPANATTFQQAQYRRAAAAAESTDRQRVAAWQAEAARRLQPWQAQVVAQIQDLAGSLGSTGLSGDGGDLPASVQAAANTLAGLPGRRVLLVLAGGRIGPATGAAPGTALAHVHIVIANLTAPTAATFIGTATAAGATVTALDLALTDLDLAATVNG